jgi:hypothetical protein
MSLGVSSMFPKQKGKTWNGARQDFQDTNISISRVKDEVTLVTFSDSQGNIHRESVPPG